MKLTRILCSTAVAATLLWANAANAELYQFNLSGDYSATWQLDTNTVPTGGHPGVSFYYFAVGGLFPGTSLGTADLYFGHGSRGGGLYIIDSGTNGALVLSKGPQLYSGSEANPDFVVGTYVLTGAMGPGSYSLDISAVPEPTTYAMMLTGLGLVGFVLRRRHLK